MRHITFAAELTLAAVPSHAQQAQIEGVISDQLDAFMADDFGRAFSYASPSIQGMFQTPENFGRMVRNGYPMVYRPDEVEYLGVEDMGGILRQRVLIRDAGGAFHTLEYDMIQGEAGWKINGVRLVTAPQVGA